MCTRYWYTFNGLEPDTAVGHYVAPTSTEPSCSSGGFSCSIYVCGGGTNPDTGSITPNIANYLAIAKANSFQFYPFDIPYVKTRQ